MPHYTSTDDTDWDEYARIFGRSLIVTPGQIEQELCVLDGEVVVQMEDGNVAVSNSDSDRWDVTTSPVVVDQIKSMLENQFMLIP